MWAIRAAPAPTTRRAALGVAAVALAGAVWAPLLGNFFRADDFVHLLAIANGEPLRFLLGQTGGHAYLARNAVFWASTWAFGPHPAPFFATVLATHLVNVALVFALVARLAASARLAFLVAALWGTMPLNEGTLGWYSVYGQVLLTTVVLGLLLRVTGRARHGAAVPLAEVAIWYATMLLATTLFGVGIGMAIVLPVAITLVLPAGRLPAPARRLLFTLPLAVVGLYVVLSWLSRLTGEPVGALQAYTLRHGLGWPPILMLVRLLASGIADLLGSFWCLGGACAAAPALVAAYVGLVGATLLLSPASRQRAITALALLAVAGYGMIALGRGALGIPASEPRYHYAGTALLALVLGAAAGGVAARLPGGRRADLVVAAVVALGALAFFRSGWRIDHFAVDRDVTTRALATIQAAIDAAPPGQPVYIRNRPYRTPSGIIILRDFPGWAGLFAIFQPGNVVRGHRVFFVARDAAELALARPGTRLGELLVAAPGATPAASGARR
jgi:hypothetical protein